MDDFNVWGMPTKGRKRKQDSSLFGGGLGLGMKPPKTQKNPFNVGIGLRSDKEHERDSRRSFGKDQRAQILHQQNNKCAVCHRQLDPRDIEYDHIKPWADKGRTITENGRALCGSCHNKVSHRSRLKKTNKKRKSKRDNLLGLGF